MGHEGKSRAARAARRLCIAVLAAAAAGCGGGTPPAPAASGGSPSSSPSAAANAPKRYHLEGKVVSIDKAQQSIVVDAKEIPGFMAAMAMPYPVAKVAAPVLDKLGPGDQITADVVANDTGFALENIVVVKKGDGGAAKPAALAQPSGEAVPALALVNQDGKRVDLQGYRGKALLVTFIYTRCPLADYCPLMTHNFAAIEKSLAKDPTLYAKTHLLSISFDGQFDTPEVLRQYAAAYGQKNFGHWEFAALPAGETREATRFFNIVLMRQDGQISHSLATAILTPQGTLFRTYSGNEWKTATVLADLAQAAALPVGERTETAAAR